MNEDSIRKIKIWILDHACKHGIESLIKVIVKDTNLEDIFEENTSEIEVNVTFLFSHLLNSLIKSLKTARHDKVNKYTSWNKQLLVLVTELLITSYCQEKYISLKHFFNLVTRLKRMELLSYLFENIPNTTVVERLNISLPRWDSSYEVEIQKLYGFSERILEKLKDGHTKFRRFILPLTVSSAAKQSYIDNNLGKDMKAFINNSLVDLIKISNVIKMKAGPSVIEKIVLETLNEQHQNNPAVQIILEYIQADMKESDFMALLQSFNPNMELCAGDNILDTLSELGSEPDLISGMDDVEMYTSSEDDDEKNHTTVKKVIFPKNSDPLKGSTGHFIPADNIIECISDSDDGGA